MEYSSKKKTNRYFIEVHTAEIERDGVTATDMASASSSREARRRKIMERGSDRLAFITGQVQSVPPPPPPPSIAAHSPEPSDSPGEYRHPLLSKQSDEHSASPTVLPKQDTSSRHEISNNDDPHVEQLIRNEDIPSPSVETRSGSEISPLVDQPTHPPRNLSKSFSPSQVTSAIASSERIRLLCSTIAGLLVVLWNIGFPFISSNVFSSLLMMKPVYLVLLTNLTIVVSLLIFGTNLRSGKTPRVENTNPLSGNDWVSQIGNSLELGLMMMNVVDAVVMDFSLYAVVVVCGVLLGQVFF